MPVTVAQVLDRALNRSVANRGKSLVFSDADVVQRVDLAQRDVYQALAEDGRAFNLAYVTVASTASVSGAPRVATFPTALRILRVVRTVGRDPVALVDPRNPDAEWDPRAFVSAGVGGATLTEVGNGWDPGSPDAVQLTALVSAAPTPLAALSDTVSLPDAFTDLLDNRLAKDLAAKDVGRDPDEFTRYDAEYAERLASYKTSVRLQNGLEARAETRPAPEAKP